MRKLQSPKVNGENTKKKKKKKPSNITKVDPQTLKNFLVCCCVAIRVPR
jgi:hypothetical protein